MTHHSWQSMRDHFRKKIVPNINNYSLRKLEVAKLTGTTTQPGLQWGGTKNPTPPQDASGKVTIPCVQGITHTLTHVGHWGRIYVASSVLLTVPQSTIADFRSSVSRQTSPVSLSMLLLIFHSGSFHEHVVARSS